MEISEFLNQSSRIKLWIIAENIRSAYNIGAMFRTADGTGIAGILLLGYSPDPKNPKVAKTSLGAEKNVPWIRIEYSDLEKIMKDGNMHLLETGIGGESLYSANIELPMYVVVGNEVEGISSNLIKAINSKVFIPMNGTKESLNVAEATSILMYEIYRRSLTKF